jgi:hypothetical protein
MIDQEHGVKVKVWLWRAAGGVPVEEETWAAENARTSTTYRRC